MLTAQPLAWLQTNTVTKMIKLHMCIYATYHVSFLTVNRLRNI